MMTIHKCAKCDMIVPEPVLCEECFFEEFEKMTGKKPEWVFNESKQEWEHVYKGIGFKYFKDLKK